MRLALVGVRQLEGGEEFVPGMPFARAQMCVPTCGLLWSLARAVTAWQPWQAAGWGQGMLKRRAL